jgi:hypothetical protein
LNDGDSHIVRELRQAARHSADLRPKSFHHVRSAFENYSNDIVVFRPVFCHFVVDLAVDAKDTRAIELSVNAKDMKADLHFRVKLTSAATSLPGL